MFIKKNPKKTINIFISSIFIMITMFILAGCSLFAELAAGIIIAMVMPKDHFHRFPVPL